MSDRSSLSAASPLRRRFNLNPQKIKFAISICCAQEARALSVPSVTGACALLAASFPFSLALAADRPGCAFPLGSDAARKGSSGSFQLAGLAWSYHGGVMSHWIVELFLGLPGLPLTTPWENSGAAPQWAAKFKMQDNLEWTSHHTPYFRLTWTLYQHHANSQNPLMVYLKTSQNK
ncbi:hypothetical protein B0H63DRAFT_117606 [Podospora didyma]|uniref:Uncharacterized protein n=1 Tax=Podospora didyma TaxID=330526 RepID=A0AAE0NZH7_9PEZI|nr:hypothetical protein B0H63DRAFT_117606 [Podospora didyma]